MKGVAMHIRFPMRPKKYPDGRRVCVLTAAIATALALAVVGDVDVVGDVNDVGIVDVGDVGDVATRTAAFDAAH